MESTHNAESEPCCVKGLTQPCGYSCPRQSAEKARIRADALLEAAADVDLTGYYDPSPTGRVSTSCHLAENAVRDWLRELARDLSIPPDKSRNPDLRE